MTIRFLNSILKAGRNMLLIVVLPVSAAENNKTLQAQVRQLGQPYQWRVNADQTRGLEINADGTMQEYEFDNQGMKRASGELMKAGSPIPAQFQVADPEEVPEEDNFG